MGQFSKFAMLGLAMGLTGATQAADITLSGNITTSTTLTANNVYNLSGEVRVLPGVTLTIEAGTVFATVSGANQGTLAVARGGKIFINGTKDKPVIMTSAADRATWTANDPKTGTWRATANEWGSLAIMGRAYISNTKNVATNTSVPNANNVSPMEGLVAQFVGDPNILYGGETDDDDSGSISYLSIRYGGKVLALANELNGMSLGGVGRETDIHHIEIMNNVDDGIEIFGGTVNIKYFSVWNIGDDSFDVDQGWRGKAQFGLIVTGYSLVASSGSGFPDNGFEIDGAEKADSQPVTASVLYNMTYIGVPESIAANSADHATEWRDNANVQFRNCIFMDTGEDIVKGANGASDGEGSNGYGFNGTLNWDVRWTTAFSHNHNAANPNAGGFLTAQLQALYPAQVDGNLIEIKDSVFFNNTDSTAYTEANTRQVFAAQNNNVQEPATSPIVAIARTSTAPFGATNGQGRTVHNVTNLDPRAAGDAITSVATAPNDGFFTQAKYRGAFSKDVNWLLGWTASHAFGFHAGQTNPADPAVTLKVHLTTVSFLAANGVSYSIEKSTNGLTWTPVSGLVGDGTTKTISDVLGASFEATVLYRVIMN